MNKRMRRLIKFAWLLSVVAILRAPLATTHSFYTNNASSTHATFSTGCWVAPSVPVLASPANHQVYSAVEPGATAPLFDWLDSLTTCPGGMIEYQFEISRYADFHELEMPANWITPSQIALPPISADTHYWRVRARDQHGNVSAYSAVWDVTVEEPLLTLTKVDEEHVRVRLQNAHLFDSFEYELTYHYVFQGNPMFGAISSTLSIGGQHDVSEDLYLGTCSSGGVCVAHEGLSDLVVGGVLHSITYPIVNMHASLPTWN